MQCEPGLLDHATDRVTSTENLLGAKLFTQVIGMICCRCGRSRLFAGIGGPCRDRTYDQEIKSLLLYQLS
jgi:hypothetical protein